MSLFHPTYIFYYVVVTFILNQDSVTESSLNLCKQIFNSLDIPREFDNVIGDLEASSNIVKCCILFKLL